MDKIIEKAYAKINLGLDVLGKRTDGYHEVKMIMHSVGLYDELTFEKSIDGKRHYNIAVNGLSSGPSNLICRAAELFCEKYEIDEGFSIGLVKRIPMAAGLAGGSSDAAAVIRGFSKLFNISAGRDSLVDLGKRIGADVPFCIFGGTALAEGIGERLTEISPLPPCSILIAKPKVDISTKWAYDTIDNPDICIIHPDINSQVSALRRSNLKDVCDRMGNVFESIAIPRYPIIKKIKEVMIECGSVGSLMSGSGPTVFGIFSDDNKMEEAAEKLKSYSLECISKIRE